MIINGRFFQKRMQLKKFVAYRLGDHLDSHHHVHTDWSIYRLLRPLAQKYRITTIRLSADLHKVNIFKKVYKGVYNTLLRKDFASYDHFCEIDEYSLNEARGITEVMVHPLTNEGVMYDSDKLFEENIHKVFAIKNSKIRGWGNA